MTSDTRKLGRSAVIKTLAMAGVLAIAAHSAQAENVTDWWQQEQLRTEAEQAEANLPDCIDCATITRVEQEKHKGKGSAKGVILGGVIGGLLGNQVGKGDGNTAATVAGVVGGALIGREIEKNQNRRNVWVVGVRDRYGVDRQFIAHDKPDWIVGQVVRINGNEISNYPSRNSQLRVMMPADSYYGWDYNDQEAHIFADSI